MVGSLRMPYEPKRVGEMPDTQLAEVMAELDSMLREARAPKVHDRRVNYVVKKNPHAEELRLRLFSERGQSQTGHRFLDFDRADDLESLSEGRWTEMKHSDRRAQPEALVPPNFDTA